MRKLECKDVFARGLFANDCLCFGEKVAVFKVTASPLLVTAWPYLPCFRVDIPGEWRVSQRVQIRGVQQAKSWPETRTRTNFITRNPNPNELHPPKPEPEPETPTFPRTNPNPNIWSVPFTPNLPRNSKMLFSNYGARMYNMFACTMCLYNCRNALSTSDAI